MTVAQDTSNTNAPPFSAPEIPRSHSRVQSAPSDTPHSTHFSTTHVVPHAPITQLMCEQIFTSTLNSFVTSPNTNNFTSESV